VNGQVHKIPISYNDYHGILQRTRWDYRTITFKAVESQVVEKRIATFEGRGTLTLSTDEKRAV
tara:strand:+ start:24405 stop:24593 length:189 start_codon:yes stop_codon:yes gene_type:complete